MTASGSILDDTSPDQPLPNLIGGEWTPSKATESTPITNPATGELIATLPRSTIGEVDAAIAAAQAAFLEWRAVPAVNRSRLFFKLHGLIQDNFEDLSRICTIENGKTLSESRGEVIRTLENVELAAGIPSLQMGDFSADVAPGIDETMIREPLGVFAHIAPFNFPSMVPFWFAPYAVATGNTYVIKPSSQAPISQRELMRLALEAGFPPGVFNLVHGSREVGERLCQHPDVRGVSFVGSTPVAQHVYSTATAAGKRAQCQGGAKNYLVVLPDAVLDATARNMMGSIFGCAGERCLAGSNILVIGDVYEEFKERLVTATRDLKVGDGLDPATGVGPVISRAAQERITGYIDRAVEAGATPVVDGRGVKVEGYPDGYWVGPTILEDVTLDMEVAKDEIFGPVVTLIRMDSLDEAIAAIDNDPFGNAASIYTSHGGLAREFAQRVNIGNVGVNIGLAAPMAFFPFGGRKLSFFGTMHGQGMDAVQFFTDPKVVITRWPERTDGREPWD
jgi:malonate-semialdehyde dehydrogenase (acetylating) / methylmalonate-semialdehyde dehydrogenase